MFTRITSAVSYPGLFTDNDKSLLLDAAKMAVLAYKEGVDLQQRWESYHTGPRTGPVPEEYDVLQRLDEPDILDDRRAGLQAFACEYQPTGYAKKVLAMIVRDTNEIADAFQPAQIEQVEFGNNTYGNRFDGVRVHKGWLRQYKSLIGQWGKKIGEFLDKGGVVMFVGHSLGAAVSTIAAFNYGTYKQDKIWNVTIGSPPVGNEEFANQCNQYVGLLWRVKNRCDPVCKALPSFTGYRQAGPEIHVGDPDPLPEFPGIWDWGDHWNYISALTGNAMTPGLTFLDVIVSFKQLLQI